SALTLWNGVKTSGTKTTVVHPQMVRLGSMVATLDSGRSAVGRGSTIRCTSARQPQLGPFRAPPPTGLQVGQNVECLTFGYRTGPWKRPVHHNFTTRFAPSLPPRAPQACTAGTKE